MPIERIDALVVGGGQAGVAMSEHLSKNRIPHLVLERSGIAERWRSERWDSLVANGPAWHDRFPGLEFEGVDPGAFAPKERVADYFVDYAKKINAPIRCGVEVLKVQKNEGRAGFRVETSGGVIEAQSVVAATGPFQRAVIPAIAPETAGLMQTHSNAYRNPGQLPKGAVLVVGGGSSGVQIADELQRAGRRVYLSVGPHDRPPRAYRGQTIDFRRLASEGMTLVGRTQSFAGDVVTFDPGLVDSIAHGDANYLSVLDQADAYSARNGLDLPPEPEARNFAPDPDCVRNPILELGMAKAGISSIIWATGFALDFGWLQVDVFDADGKPQHQRGVSSEPGVYFIGLPWLSRRGSSFIWGVWHDAWHVADHIATQRSYRAHYLAAQDNP